jgi:hypothetical protein
MVKNSINHGSVFVARRDLRKKGLAFVACVAWSCLLVLALPVAAQTVVASARVMCEKEIDTAGPIVGAVINQTNTTITDLEIELSIITRDKKGLPKRLRDTPFSVVPSLNQTGMVTTLGPNGSVYFSIPGRNDAYSDRSDITCRLGMGLTSGESVLNVAAIAITRINGKSLLTTGRDGKPLKQAPLASMLQIRPYFPPAPQHVPTQREVIEAIREKNELLQETIINRQLKDCLSHGTWACAYNNDTNINVVISQQ